MLLAIDVGNTNTLFALCEAGEIRARWRISTDWQRTADEYAVWLHQLMQMAGIASSAVDSVIVACVVPQMLFNLRRLARRYFGMEAMVVGAPGVALGMPITIPQPSDVGADRVVNAIAAHAQWPGDCIVVDFGTATTFDVVGRGGTFDGGLICPGINLSMDALYRAAARLPRVAVEPPAAGLGIIGRGTVHAMQSGLFWGYVSMVEGLVARIGAELGRPATVIATGGLAPLFARHTVAIHHVDGDLTIKGLMLVFQRNAEGQA